MAEFGWAIVGPGRIAQRFAQAVQALPETRLIGVQGRDAQRAGTFAQAWSRSGEPAVSVFADVDRLLDDPRVSGVYIATPNALHAATALRCLQAGKPVLCEKPLAVNAAQVGGLIFAARQQRVFMMEALWTRFLPIYASVGEWLATQAIGAVRGLQSNFCFNVPFDAQARHFDPNQAGGCLLDIGIYNLSMTQWVLDKAFGACPPLATLDAQGALGPTGVDRRVAASLQFAGGVVSQFQCSFDGCAENSLRIFGEHGTICVPNNFWEATSATLQRSDAAPETIERPFRINGFEGEIEEAMRCIGNGEFESPMQSHASSLAVVEWMDRIRATLGVRYPFE